MNRLNLLFAAVSLVACAKAPSKSDPPQNQTPAPAVAPAPTAPAKPAPPLAVILQTAEFDNLEPDAIRLGTAIDAYIVERAGIRRNQTQQIETLLVLVSSTGHHISRISERNAGIDGKPLPFGSMRTIRALPAPRPYTSADGFTGDSLATSTSELPSKGQLLFVQSTEDAFGQQHRLLVGREHDSLVVWTASRSSAAGPVLGWHQSLSLPLAPGAATATPAGAVPAPSYGDEVKVTERIDYTVDGQHTLSFVLHVGEARALLGTCTDDATHTPAFKGVRTWSATPVDPSVGPPKGTFVATRMCRNAGEEEHFAIEQKNKKLTLWTFVLQEGEEWNAHVIPTL